MVRRNRQGRAYRITFIVLAAVVLSLMPIKQAATADLPPEFVGVWILAAPQGNECKRSDWKGVAASSTDRLINIAPGVLEMWESGCKIVSARPQKSFFKDRNTVGVDLSCGGEGMTWREQDTWHIQNIDQRRTLVMATVKTTELRDDTGKRVSSEANRMATVNIYLECK
jgi:hypothetical protein